MWELLRRFRALDPAARGIFLRASVLLPLISLCLRIVGFHRTQVVLHLASLLLKKDCPLNVQGAQEAQVSARMVRAAARYGFGSPSCLAKSLVLSWLLRRRGVASRLRIGTRKVRGEFHAHAWVEIDGAPLGEVEEPRERYAAFESEFAVQSSGIA